MEVLVIGNPIAGHGKTPGLIRRFVSILERRGHHVETYLSEGPGDATARAGAVDGHVERLVVAGGDGTINEVINGLPDPSLVPILHLSTGTANMMARDLNLPRGLKPLADVLEKGSVRRLNVGLVGDRRFLLLVSAGFDATVTEVLKEARGKTLGYLGYLTPILKAIGRYRPMEMSVTVDDNEPVVGAVAMALKVRNYGGYFVFDDHAGPDAGRFSVLVFQDGTIPALLKYYGAALLRAIPKLDGVTRLHGSRVKIESSEPVAVQMDGDYFGVTPIQAEIHSAEAAMLVSDT